MDFSTILRWANYLTIARILMVPLFMSLFSFGQTSWALVVFVVAAITDYLDGVVARLEGPTSFGRFMDPLADKLLVGAALISFTRVGDGLSPGWMVLTIIGREFVITSLRVAMVAMQGTAVGASMWGKYKTSSQMLVIILALILLVVHDHGVGSHWLVTAARESHGPIYFAMYIPLVLTVLSGLEFLYNNRKALHKLVVSNQTYPGDDGRL